MVAFGKKLKDSQIQEWQGHYINYKLLKKKVRRYTQQHEAGSENPTYVFKDFSRMLDCQIEKIVLFLLEQQGVLASRLSLLGEQRDALLQHQDGYKVSEIQEAYRSVGRDLLRLLYFVEMNAVGVRKILKKFDKRLGYKFTDYYVKTRANHPYSQLQQVFKQVGIGAVIGALSRNLVELQDQQGNYVSIYDQPALSHPDPVIHSIREAVTRLSNSTNFLNFLGKHAFIMENELPSPSEDHVLDERFHFMSLFLNLANTFLYMVNTYIIVPTADNYSLSLGAAATVCGVVIGSMAVAQVFSSVYFSAWSNRSYLKPLIFSSVALLVGNVLYAIAYDLNSISILLIGRLCCGLGSARAVNRRYITDCVPLKLRMQASAGFVSASALGMACGPAIACLLQTNFTICSITFNEDTLPGWIMAFAWLVYLIWLCIAFREPQLDLKEDFVPTERNAGPLLNDTVESSYKQPLLLNLEAKQQDEDEDADQEYDDDNDVDPRELQKPVTSIVAAYRLLTPSVKAYTSTYCTLLRMKTVHFGIVQALTCIYWFCVVKSTVGGIESATLTFVEYVLPLISSICLACLVQLFIYFMLKYAMEILLAESSVITEYYFIWSTTTVAIFLACLGLTVLPVNILVGSYINNIFEERQILLASEIMVCIGILLSFHILVPYSVPQYVSSALITFVAAEVLEGVNLSLLSRVMSSRLSRGTYNGGLLSTEAGTLARVIADGTITLSGYLGEDRVLNVTLIPSLCICIASIVATCFTYNSLY